MMQEMKICMCTALHVLLSKQMYFPSDWFQYHAPFVFCVYYLFSLLLQSGQWQFHIDEACSLLSIPQHSTSLPYHWSLLVFIPVPKQKGASFFFTVQVPEVCVLFVLVPWYLATSTASLLCWQLAVVHAGEKHGDYLMQDVVTANIPLEACQTSEVVARIGEPVGWERAGKNRRNTLKLCTTAVSDHPFRGCTWITCRMSRDHIINQSISFTC